MNFVWWIGIGHAGTLISAVLLLFNQPWRTSINRFAEAMTLFAVTCAGIFPLIHLGRPWLAYWLLPYPNITFVEFLIVWMGDLPEESDFYLRRVQGGWALVPILLALFHVAVPFLWLLSRRNRRRLPVLGSLGLMILLGRLLDLVWLVEPAFREESARWPWLYVLSILATGAPWLVLVLRSLHQPIPPKEAAP